jgi:predicted dehydrogenase
MKKIRLGIIGCGIAANNIHLPALQKLHHKFEITAVCNHTEQKAVIFAKKVGGVPYHLDYRDLLARNDVDAVDIILPINLNCKVTLDSLKAGKHVLLEKPLAANSDEGYRLVNAEKQTRLVTMVAENFRYRSGLHWLKEQIDNKVIGTPHAFFWNVFHLMDEKNNYAQTTWRINHQYAGGFITDGGIHNIAAIRFLFGDLTHQQALIKSINRAIGEIDSFTLQFTTYGKIIGVLNIFISTKGFNENKIFVIGDKGSIESSNGIYSILQEGKKRKKRFKDDNGYIEEFEDFYSAIVNGHQVQSSFKTAYDDLATLFSALENAEYVE